MYLFDENVHVPLILSMPGITVGALRVPQIASLVDLTPTVLDLLGLPIPPSLEGRSLLAPTPGIAHFMTDYASLQVGLRQGRYKLIDELDTGRSRLFDVAADPGEQHNLASAMPDRALRYRAYLDTWLTEVRARRP